MYGLFKIDGYYYVGEIVHSHSRGRIVDLECLNKTHREYSYPCFSAVSKNMIFMHKEKDTVIGYYLLEYKL